MRCFHPLSPRGWWALRHTGKNTRNRSIHQLGRLFSVQRSPPARVPPHPSIGTLTSESSCRGPGDALCPDGGTLNFIPVRLCGLRVGVNGARWAPRWRCRHTAAESTALGTPRPTRRTPSGGGTTPDQQTSTWTRGGTKREAGFGERTVGPHVHAVGVVGGSGGVPVSSSCAHASCERISDVYVES